MILSTILLSDVKCTEAIVNVLVPQISMIINGIFGYDIKWDPLYSFLAKPLNTTKCL